MLGVKEFLKKLFKTDSKSIVKNKAAFLLFVFGTFFAWLFNGYLAEFFTFIGDWERYKGRFSWMHSVIVLGHLVWLSWLFLAFLRRGTIVSLTLWSLSLAYNIWMVFIYVGSFIGLVYFWGYMIWHIITFIVTVRSLSYDLKIFKARLSMIKKQA